VFSRFLVGDSAGAKEDLEKSLEIFPSFTQSWVKVASVHMEQGNAAKAFAAFESAIAHNPRDPDIFYHRGQGGCSSMTTIRPVLMLILPIL
jgi:mitochondrial import receptor subunit TOM70